MNPQYVLLFVLWFFGSGSGVGFCAMCLWRHQVTARLTWDDDGDSPAERKVRHMYLVQKMLVAAGLMVSQFAFFLMGVASITVQRASEVAPSAQAWIWTSLLLFVMIVLDVLSFWDLLTLHLAAKAFGDEPAQPA